MIASNLDITCGVRGAEERLRVERQQLLAALADDGRVEAPGMEIWGDDASLEIQQLEVEYRHHEALARRLRHVDEALERISGGDYGGCLRCGREISPRRLAADPAVVFCVSCQESVEVDFHLWSL